MRAIHHARHSGMNVVAGLVCRHAGHLPAHGFADLHGSGGPYRIALQTAGIEAARSHRMQQAVARRVLARAREQHRVDAECRKVTCHIERRTAQDIAVAEPADQRLAERNQSRDGHARIHQML